MKISNEEIVELRSDAREEVQVLEEDVVDDEVILPLEPHGDEEDSDEIYEILNFDDNEDSYQDSRTPNLLWRALLKNNTDINFSNSLCFTSFLPASSTAFV